jgi:hypothetical protein
MRLKEQVKSYKEAIKRVVFLEKKFKTMNKDLCFITETLLQRQADRVIPDERNSCF